MYYGATWQCYNHEDEYPHHLKDGKLVTNSKQTINFKDPRWIIMWLDTALKKEKTKYEKEPVKADMSPEHMVAQAWGYVVVGYFLVEEAFKALLHLRNKHVPRTHSLSILFGLFEDNDKGNLREFYTDYRATAGGRISEFPYETLEDFLANLDGDPSKKGNDHVGSFAWRYFLIEEKRSQKMPTVSIEYLHEIAYGCIVMIESLHYDRDDPQRYTNSRRMRRKRGFRQNDWLTVRMNSDGWGVLGDRLEILWGPDCFGRHDLLLFKGKSMKGYFCELPKDFELPIVDKRKEIEDFDVKEGLVSVGILMGPPSK